MFMLCNIEFVLMNSLRRVLRYIERLFHIKPVSREEQYDATKEIVEKRTNPYLIILIVLFFLFMLLLDRFLN
jgi:uncharacterized membrane protein